MFDFTSDRTIKGDYLAPAVSVVPVEPKPSQMVKITTVQPDFVSPATSGNTGVAGHVQTNNNITTGSIPTTGTTAIIQQDTSSQSKPATNPETSSKKVKLIIAAFAVIAVTMVFILKTK